MADEHAAEPPPGNPGQRALGAMESAVRRARETAGAPPLAPSPVAPAPVPRRGLSMRHLRPGSDPGSARHRPLADPLRRRRGRPRRGGRHCVDRLAERQLGSPVLDRGRWDPHQHSAAVSPSLDQGRRSGASSLHDHLDHFDHAWPSLPAALRSSLRSDPSSGSAGQSVTVAGANFLSTSGQIVATFNGQVAPTSCPAQNTCTITVPSSTSPSAQVVITTSGGTSNAVTFTYS